MDDHSPEEASQDISSATIEMIVLDRWCTARCADRLVIITYPADPERKIHEETKHAIIVNDWRNLSFEALRRYCELKLSQALIQQQIELGPIATKKPRKRKK